MISAPTLRSQIMGSKEQASGASLSIKATQVIGLPGLTANSAGVLSLTRTSLRFQTPKTLAEVPLLRLIAVSGDGERVETGGTTGRVARLLIPYGGGLALGAVTHKQVGLLTVEYLDERDQYHGVVFVVSPDEVPFVLAKIGHGREQTVQTAPVAAVCPEWKVQANTVRVEPLDQDYQAGLPSVDRVLIYEDLVQQLSAEKSISTVFRAGDLSPEASCAEFVVKIRAEAFDKGDQAIRASVGPLGHFVGTTRIAYHLALSRPDGTAVMDRDLRASEGSDTDSLNVTKKISKTVVKGLKRSRTDLRKSQSA